MNTGLLRKPVVKQALFCQPVLRNNTCMPTQCNPTDNNCCSALCCSSEQSRGVGHVPAAGIPVEHMCTGCWVGCHCNFPRMVLALTELQKIAQMILSRQVWTCHSWVCSSRHTCCSFSGRSPLGVLGCLPVRQMCCTFQTITACRTSTLSLLSCLERVCTVKHYKGVLHTQSRLSCLEGVTREVRHSIMSST